LCSGEWRRGRKERSSFSEEKEAKRLHEFDAEGCDLPAPNE
jgi:hypothetical protein